MADAIIPRNDDESMSARSETVADLPNCELPEGAFSFLASSCPDQINLYHHVADGTVDRDCLLLRDGKWQLGSDSSAFPPTDDLTEAKRAAIDYTIAKAEAPFFDYAVFLYSLGLDPDEVSDRLRLLRTGEWKTSTRYLWPIPVLRTGGPVASAEVIKDPWQ